MVLSEILVGYPSFIYFFLTTPTLLWGIVGVPDKKLMRTSWSEFIFFSREIKNKCGMRKTKTPPIPHLAITEPENNQLLEKKDKYHHHPTPFCPHSPQGGQKNVNTENFTCERQKVTCWFVCSQKCF